MNYNISDQACETLMTKAVEGCPDGGLSSCYDCTRKAILAVLSEINLHEYCVSLPNFKIDRNANPYVAEPPTTGVGNV